MACPSQRLIYFSSVSFTDERVARVKRPPGSRSSDKKRRRRKREEGQQMMAWWTAEMAFQCPLDASPFRVFLTRQSGRRLVFRLTASITQTRSSIPTGVNAAVYLNLRASNSTFLKHSFYREENGALADALRRGRFTYLPIRLGFVLARIRFLINNGLAHTRRDNATMVFVSMSVRLNLRELNRAWWENMHLQRTQFTSYGLHISQNFIFIFNIRRYQKLLLEANNKDTIPLTIKNSFITNWILLMKINISLLN